MILIYGDSIILAGETTNWIVDEYKFFSCESSSSRICNLALSVSESVIAKVQNLFVYSTSTAKCVSPVQSL